MHVALTVKISGFPARYGVSLPTPSLTPLRSMPQTSSTSTNLGVEPDATRSALLKAINDRLAEIADRFGIDASKFQLSDIPLREDKSTKRSIEGSLFDLYALSRGAGNNGATVREAFQREVVEPIDRAYDNGLQLLRALGDQKGYDRLAQNVVRMNTNLRTNKP